MAPGEIDLSLLRGVRFRCRPGCGLCCYTTPAVEAGEAERLIQIDPNVPFLVGDRGWRYIDSRGDGGACHFLDRTRCRAHAERPFPCREFPLSVHLGTRAQATVVLSCPGIESPPWSVPAKERGSLDPPAGLEEEIGAVERAYSGPTFDPRLRANRRKWERLEERRAGADGWPAPEEIGNALRNDRVELARTTYDEVSSGGPGRGSLDELPLGFDEEAGLVAIAPIEGEWRLVRVEESGTQNREVARFQLPAEVPDLARPAERLLDAYLAYLLERDFTYWAAAEWSRASGEADLGGIVGADLGVFGALVIARAELWRSWKAPDRPRLEVTDLWKGIQVTDGEFLDRPTLGGVL